LRMGADANVMYATFADGDTLLATNGNNERSFGFVRELASRNEVDVDSKNAVGGTSLMVASIQGHLDMVCKFVGLVGKLQVNAEDVKGDTALMWTSHYNDNLDVLVRGLVKHESDFNCQAWQRSYCIDVGKHVWPFGCGALFCQTKRMVIQQRRHGLQPQSEQGIQSCRERSQY
jgi:hypothetical protein